MFSALGILLEEIPLWDWNIKFLYVSKWGSSDEDCAEAIIVIAIAIIVVERKQPTIRPIVPSTATFEERIATAGKVGVAV